MLAWIRGATLGQHFLATYPLNDKVVVGLVIFSAVPVLILQGGRELID